MKTTVNPRNGRPVKSSADRLFGWHTIFEKGHDGEPYMTRIWIGRLRLHIFHRGDLDPDCHDHPWDFWTFPLTSYVEEFVLPDRFADAFELHRQVVPAWRWSFRPSEHTHRVLGRFGGWLRDLPPGSFEDDPDRWELEPLITKGKIVTLVWRGKPSRAWGFLKNRDGKWCWIAWRDYIFNGGKEAPCE